MLLQFGLSLDERSYPSKSTAAVHFLAVGPKSLLQYLEEGLGLSLPDNDLDYLRIEQYRQALKVFLTNNANTFFAKSFLADDLATAAELLNRRDELKAVGWSFCFNAADKIPERLQVIASVEQSFQKNPTLQLFPGLADRQAAVIEKAVKVAVFVKQIQLVEPLDLLPPIWKRLFIKLKESGVEIIKTKAELTAERESDLAQFRHFLATGSKIDQLKGDGSLLLLRGFRETHLAAYLAKIIAANKNYQPAILSTYPGPTLDHSFKIEGLPGLGIPSASIARPSLQVLKLLPVFLWEPLDPYKLMEFVSLGIKPLDEELSRRIAIFLAETPGLYSDRWFGMLAAFFEQYLPEKWGSGHPEIQLIRKQFDFWFNRRRVDSKSGKVAKREIREMYASLHEWALDVNKESTEKAGTFFTLARQAGKLVDLFDALPEDELSFLELERVVRTIYQPTPINDQVAEEGCLPVVFHPNAITGEIEKLIWWEFIEKEPDYFFARWYLAELNYLENEKVFLDQPTAQNERLVWARKQPFLQTKSQLILCVPDYSLGSKVHPHSLMGDLEAAYGDLEKISLHIDKEIIPEAWQEAFTLPKLVKEKAALLGPPPPFVTVNDSPLMGESKEQTPTSLEQLLYYPYQWVFRYRLKLRKSSILSLIEDNRLFGNLAHRLIERLLKVERSESWTKSEVETWVEQMAPDLLKKEGASLLLYGREPERITFIKHLKNAAWSLILLLQQNNWATRQAEEKVEGNYGPIAIKGRADLVLERGDELAVVDLKWRGKTRYSNSLKNSDDIQLSIYSKLVNAKDDWAHTAYFIIEKGEMLVRNTQAFKQVQAVQEEVNHHEIYNDLLQKIGATYEWRTQQLSTGKIEIRCTHTAELLEEEYANDLMDLIEMKHENAPFDDYKVLIHLIN